MFQNIKKIMRIISPIIMLYLFAFLIVYILVGRDSTVIFIMGAIYTIFAFLFVLYLLSYTIYYAIKKRKNKNTNSESNED